VAVKSARYPASNFKYLGQIVRIPIRKLDLNAVAIDLSAICDHGIRAANVYNPAFNECMQGWITGAKRRLERR
jgi:hypothetical protein